MYILQHLLQPRLRNKGAGYIQYGCPDAGRAARLKWNLPTGNYPLPPGDANLEGAPYSGTERPPLLKARGVGLIPGGPGRELAAGFEQCEEKEVSPHTQHTPGN